MPDTSLLVGVKTAVTDKSRRVFNQPSCVPTFSNLAHTRVANRLIAAVFFSDFLLGHWLFCVSLFFGEPLVLLCNSVPL